MKNKINSLKSKLFLGGMLSCSVVFSQSGVPDVSNSVKSSVETITVAYIIDFVSVGQSTEDEGVQAKEGQSLQIGDIIRTGDDSAVRIIFPDGTAQTLCANTTYKVADSGSETGEQGEDTNAAAVAAFSQCNIKPRYIGKRCFFGNNSIFDHSQKAGAERQLASESQTNTGNSNQQNTQTANNSEVPQDGFRRASCTLGENLFATYIPFSDIQLEGAPEPTTEPTTVQQTGASPTQ